MSDTEKTADAAVELAVEQTLELKKVTAERDALLEFARFALQYDEPTWAPAEPNLDLPARWMCHSCIATVDTEDDSHIPDMEHQDDCLWLRAYKVLNPEE